jgi:hypothetical protein
MKLSAASSKTDHDSTAVKSSSVPSDAILPLHAMLNLASEEDYAELRLLSEYEADQANASLARPQKTVGLIGSGQSRLVHVMQKSSTDHLIANVNGLFVDVKERKEKEHLTPPIQSPRTPRANPVHLLSALTVSDECMSVYISNLFHLFFFF